MPGLSNSQASGATTSASATAPSGAGGGITARRREGRPIASKVVAREAEDRRLVLGMVLAFLAIGFVLMMYGIIDSTRTQLAKQSLSESLTDVHNQQTKYRSLMGRFATWPELEARGVVLGENQEIEEWNADASHWFLSVRDRKTGIVCQRTGELFDASSGARRAACSN